MVRLSIHPVRALKDNYVYLLVDHADRTAAVIDPSEPAPVEAALAEHGVRLVQIWNTHHHWDHTGANEALVDRHGPLEVLASAHDFGRVPRQTRKLEDGERFTWAGVEVEALFTPGHTLGAVSYRLGDDVFTGDTLFGACCGRLFEGTPEEMVRSLGRLRDLGDGMRVWCGHEYTLGCLRFAATIEPGNAALAARLARVAAAPDQPTVPLSMAEEKATNPFLRWDAPEVRAWAGPEHAGDVAVFAAVRTAKNGWKG
jgi:hydroxyacylglutathione hydrolase